MKALGIEQVFTIYGNPRANAETEWLIRTIKEEVIWPYEYKTVQEAREAIEKFAEDYNRAYPHSALGYLSPLEAKERHHKMKETSYGY